MKRQRKKRKREEEKATLQAEATQPPVKRPNPFPDDDIFYHSLERREQREKNAELMRLIDEMDSPMVAGKNGLGSPKNRLNSSQHSGFSSPCTSDDLNTPLMQRLVRK